MEGKYLNCWSFKGKIKSWPLDLGIGESEKSLSCYKRKPRVVCKTRRAFSKSEHLASLIFIEREHISQEGMNPKERHASQEAFFVGLYCTDLLGCTVLLACFMRCCLLHTNWGEGCTGCTNLMGTDFKMNSEKSQQVIQWLFDTNFKAFWLR